MPHGLMQETLRERLEPKEIKEIPELRDHRAKREKQARRERKAIPEQQERLEANGITGQILQEPPPQKRSIATVE